MQIRLIISYTFWHASIKLNEYKYFFWSILLFCSDLNNNHQNNCDDYLIEYATHKAFLCAHIFGGVRVYAATAFRKFEFHVANIWQKHENQDENYIQPSTPRSLNEKFAAIDFLAEKTKQKPAYSCRNCIINKRSFLYSMFIFTIHTESELFIFIYIQIRFFSFPPPLCCVLWANLCFGFILCRGETEQPLGKIGMNASS